MYRASVEVFKDQVIGLVPVYNSRGDETQLITAAGLIHYDGRTFHAVKKALGRAYAIDFQAQARQLREQLGRRKLLPFYLERSRVFIPVKVRQARVKNDSAYGYVNWKSINETDIRPGRAACQIRLDNGMDLTICSSPAAVIQNMHMGRQVSRWLDSRSAQEENPEHMLLEAMRILVGSFDSVQKRSHPTRKRGV